MSTQLVLDPQSKSPSLLAISAAIYTLHSVIFGQRKDEKNTQLALAENNYINKPKLYHEGLYINGLFNTTENANKIGKII